jgi:hypothetical protein
MIKRVLLALALLGAIAACTPAATPSPSAPSLESPSAPTLESAPAASPSAAPSSS